MKTRNQRGFSTLELLIVILVIVILGGVGYFVWHKQHTKSKPVVYKSSGRHMNSHPATLTTNKSTGLSTYTSTEGKFSASYPSTWVQPSHQDLCGGFLDRDLEIGPNDASVIKCGGDGTVSQISVSSEHGNRTASQDDQLSSKDYVSVKTGKVTADGVSGTSYSGVASGQQKNSGLGGLPDGTVAILDVFYKNNTTYTAAYTQYPAAIKGGPFLNEQAEFNKIVASLKFN